MPWRVICSRMSMSYTGFDNLNPYYDVQLKKDRLQTLTGYDRFTFGQIDIQDRDTLFTLFEAEQF